MVIKHGMYDAPEYHAWQNMRYRCYNPKNMNYANYGGRGIKVCDRWKSFRNFYADMGPRPSDEHSLDRYPNNDGDYEPGNCRWATIEQQNSNHRRNVYVEHEGERLTRTQVAAKVGIPVTTLRMRMDRGSTIEEALAGGKPQEIGLYTLNGQTKNLGEWGREYGINRTVLYQRIMSGKSIQEALEQQPSKKRTYEYEGNILTLRELSDKTGLSYMSLYNRICVLGKSIDEALAMG